MNVNICVVEGKYLPNGVKYEVKSATTSNGVKTWVS